MVPEKYISNLNTFSDLIDRLIVEINKLSFFENKKREEHAKENPDITLIAKWDNLSRDACEFRSLLKNEINTLLEKIIETGEYKVLKEVRTFFPPKKTIADILAERCEIASQSVKEFLKAHHDQF